MTVATKTEKEAAEKLARQANQRLHAIRDAERFVENKHLVGWHLKTQNNYSCPEKPSDRWWLYAKVQKIDKAGMITLFMFETDKYGHTTTRTDEYRYQVDGYTKIPAREFDKAWRSFQKKIATIEP